MSPLAGRRIVVTRTAEQSGGLAELLAARGAVPVVVPLIEIATDPAEAQRLAALDPGAFDWLVVTSPNGARHYLAAHATVPAHVAAVGTATSAALATAGVEPSLVPARQSAAGLLDELPAGGGGRLLLVQAAGAEATLAHGLAARGWELTVVAPYRSVPAALTSAARDAALSADAVLFASGSAARAWVNAVGRATPPVVVAIGPQTAEAAARAGLKVTVVAADHSLAGLIAALETQQFRTS